MSGMSPVQKCDVHPVSAMMVVDVLAGGPVLGGDETTADAEVPDKISLVHVISTLVVVVGTGFPPCQLLSVDVVVVVVSVVSVFAELAAAAPFLRGKRRISWLQPPIGFLMVAASWCPSFLFLQVALV
jgi:hypothetical protein